MKLTIIILAIILGTFALAFLTSWLLSWEWILAAWPRQALVIILMILEIIMGAAILRALAKNLIKE
jgi:hypothetical protein